MMKQFVLSLLLATLGAISLAHGADDDSIRAVQTRLKAGGFYSGKINGRYDKETAAGVTRYQIRNGLQITGKLDQATRYALGVTTTEPKTPMPRFGEDVWRYLKETDQAAIDKMIADEAAKNEKPNQPIASTTRTATPAPAPPGPPPPASGPDETRSGNYDNDRLHDYIAAFVLAGLDPKVGAETEFFAERVDYFGEHGVGREKIRRDLERYNQRWPERGFWLDGDLDVKPQQDRLSVSFPLRYELKNGPKRATGKVRKTLVLEKKGDNDLQIVAVDERKL